jgi:hypothetical protein
MPLSFPFGFKIFIFELVQIGEKGKNIAVLRKASKDPAW